MSLFKRLIESSTRDDVAKLIQSEIRKVNRQYRPYFTSNGNGKTTVKDTGDKLLKVYFNFGFYYRFYDASKYVEHRVGGPSTIDLHNLELKWKQNGKFHRIDGPAYVSVNKGFLYYINGKRMDKEEYLNHFDLGILL